MSIQVIATCSIYKEDNQFNSIDEKPTEPGTYAKKMNLPIPPFIGMRIMLDPEPGLDPYTVKTVTITPEGLIVIDFIADVLYPVDWGWHRIDKLPNHAFYNLDFDKESE